MFLARSIATKVKAAPWLLQPITARACSSAGSGEAVVLSKQIGRVAVLTLNRPKQLNALNKDVAKQLAAAIDEFEYSDDVGAIVLTGSERAFAAGADIKEMMTKNFVEFRTENPDNSLLGINTVERCKKPVVAAVNGIALGGGCELAMMCDIIIAGDNALFGQPEITLGIIPGAAGTQRLTHAVGKSRAMQMVLTGDSISAAEAKDCGLVSEVVPKEETVDRAVAIATKIATMSNPVVGMAKEAVNGAFELSLKEGCRLERNLFYSCFATEDRVEGMTAFAEKRKPSFKHK